MDKILNAILKEIQNKNEFRHLTDIEKRTPGKIKINERYYLNFASNDYLGLSQHPQIIEEVVKATREWGLGGGASRLISGNSILYTLLEKKLANLKQTESALVFSSGYAANLGGISSLVQAGDLILSDEYNHASLIDACRLSGATIKIFKHKDCQHLKELIKSSSNFNQKFIITDAVFSMEGDIAPLKDISEIAKKFDAFIYIDDAHGTGVLGEKGKGTHFLAGQKVEVDIIMGTLSKAIGSLGGFICGSEKLREVLVNRARSLIFSTALPPPILAGAIKSLEIIENGDDLRARLFNNVAMLRAGLKELGFEVQGETHIILIILGDNQRALDASKILKEEGIFIPAIRYPSVPRGKARLRIAPTAIHTKEEIEMALKAFAKVREKIKLKWD